jgi:hypothetical protein
MAAFFREKSAIKNLRIAKAYRQQMASVREGREVLIFMTRRLVTPEDENRLCFNRKLPVILTVADNQEIGGVG